MQMNCYQKKDMKSPKSYLNGNKIVTNTFKKLWSQRWYQVFPIKHQLEAVKKKLDRLFEVHFSNDKRKIRSSSY